MEDYAPSDFANKIFKMRYALHENEEWDEACERVSNHVSTAENGENIIRFREETNEILKKNLFMPGGRIWYGAGRAKGQLLNCFVVPTEDSREGWGQTVSDCIVISGVGGGVGINCSPIRPRGSAINGSGGTATGAVSLMEIIDAAGTVIKAGGGRRTALMLCLNLSHGDLLEFLDKKLDLNKLNNANVSVVFDRSPEEFFEKVKNNGMFQFTFRNKVISEIPAREVWNKIIKNALQGGEPGLLNMHYANKMSNVWYWKPLISTNPCITGDTMIATADGRNAVSIKQLAKEGKDIPVYSTNTETGKVEIKMGRNPRKTGSNREVWKLTLDNGTILRATPIHKIMKRDLQYVELKDLQQGDSIFPFNSFDSNGYRQVTNTGKKMSGGARRNRRQYRLIHEYFNGPVDAKQFHIHHADYNKLNDSVSNLVCMKKEDHTRLHADRIIGKLNPYHRMTSRWKKMFASHPGESNGRYSGITNKQLLEHGRKLFNQKGKVTQELWIEYAKENKLPQSLGNNFRFGKFTNFKNQISNNHKVVSVEFDCYEDVYNITVDDNHNYHVITSSNDKNYVTSSGICVKNCGEVFLPEYACCDLGALVLPRFVTGRGIEWDLLKDTVKKSVRFLDNVLTINNYPLKQIAETCKNERRIGLGVMGLHDVLLLNGMSYNSPEGLELVDKLMNNIKNYAYEASVQLAEEKGSFPIFDAEKFLKSNFVKTLRPTIRKKILEKGIRNCALLTIAPTGTTSLVCGVTSGLEPMFAPAYERRYFENDERKTEIVVHPLFKKFINEKKDVSHFQGSHDISLRDHFEMQRICQKHVDNAVSKTINVPQGTLEEELSDLYMEYFPELKGVTIYPEGSRENQPLTPISLEDAVVYANEAKSESTAIDSCKDGMCEI